MLAIRIVGITFAVILTSFFFFPFEFTILPGINTKMTLAGVGLPILGYQLASHRTGLINKQIFLLSIWAGIASIIGCFSITFNNTPDTAYATYIVSMWVWLSAAYTVTTYIRMVHGNLSTMLLLRYLIIVCVCQCILALLIDSYPNIKQIIDQYVQQGQDFLSKTNVKRLYGIGASLDVAGSRFAALLVMIAFSVTDMCKTDERKYIPLFLVAFFLIAVIGNMIARTTTIGLILAVGYWMYMSGVLTFKIDTNYSTLWSWFLWILAATIVIAVFCYHFVPGTEEKLRFAFEGFFSLVEKGEWSVSSNDRLKGMYVFPETLKTWFIGDGYFSNPTDVDPYFIGKEIGGYYMGTDVGYLRFIFYFGLGGLFAMCMVIYKAGNFCMNNLSHYKAMFVLLLLVNYIVWFKVSTDIFLVFALFLMVARSEEEDKQLQHKI